MSHTCRPGHAGVLADDCPRCDELAAHQLLLGLDETKTAALWDRMVEVNFGGVSASYDTQNDARAGQTLYLLGVWVQRFLGVEPFVRLEDLRAALTQSAVAA